jgi:hypothetical protein
MSWWDDETEALFWQATERLGEEAVSEALHRAMMTAHREHGHPVAGHPDGTAVGARDLKSAIKEQLRELLRVH